MLNTVVLIDKQTTWLPIYNNDHPEQYSRNNKPWFRELRAQVLVFDMRSVETLPPRVTVV